MTKHTWENIYELSDEQLSNLDKAEDLIEMMDLTKAENLLLEMNKEDPNCVPVLNVLAHMYGRHLSDFENAIKFYNLVLEHRECDLSAQREPKPPTPTISRAP